MINKIKPAIIVLMQLIFMQGIGAQAHANITEFLSKKLKDYTASVPREEIFIHSDREEYISGEALWFNIYLFDRQSLKPSNESKIAYFELLNSENRPVVQKKVSLENGIGQGQITLPDTLSSGTYTLRAYSNWMKNFLPYNCFIREIHVYNAFSARTFKKNVASNNLINTRSDSYSGSNTSSGLTLKVDNLKPDMLEINVITNEQYRISNSNLFYLAVQTRGNLNYLSSEIIMNELTKILIPKKQLLPGINQVTVFNSKGRPVVERYIYTPDSNLPDINLQSPDSAGLRDKISVSVDFGKNQPHSANPAYLSISVAPITGNHSVQDINDYLVFGSEFGFLNGSPLKNFKINALAPEIIDSLLRSEKSNWINWDIILADKLPDYKYLTEKDDHYLSGKLLTGDPKSPDSYKYVVMSHPGKIALFQYAKTDSNGDFRFKVDLNNKVNDLIIQPDILTKNGSLVIESPFSDIYQKSDLSVDSANKHLPEYISKWSVNHQVRKLYGISSVGSPITDATTAVKLKRFYGKPDIQINLKDYIALPVMQEVFFELLAGVSLKSKKAGWELSIADPDNMNKPFDFPPRIFIDGVAVKDPGTVAGLEPDLVEKIDVVRHKYAVGDYLFFGIVNIITKAGDFSNVPLPDYAIRLAYTVTDPVNSFIAPAYSSTELKRSRIPDFRNTLYWNPRVKSDKDGKCFAEFWTSDFVSDYEVNIQGITPEGKAFAVKKIIKIKR
jgi:hypothetical protein